MQVLINDNGKRTVCTMSEIKPCGRNYVVIYAIKDPSRLGSQSYNRPFTTLAKAQAFLKTL